MSCICKVRDSCRKSRLHIRLSNLCPLIPVNYVCINHLVELGFDFGFKVRLHLVNVRKLSKCPTTVAAVAIHAGYPIRFHSGFLVLGVLSVIAFDFYDRLQVVCSEGDSDRPIISLESISQQLEKAYLLCSNMHRDEIVDGRCTRAGCGGNENSRKSS